MNEKPTKRLKHYLGSAFYWHNKKELLTEEILTLQSQAEKATSSFQDVPIFGSFLDHRQAVIDEKMEKEKEYREAVRLCKEKLEEIQLFIDSLDSYKERTVMEFRYIYFLEWMDIAIRLNYSIQNVNKIHSDALLHLLKKHEEIIEKSGRRLF
jgi:DNA-directed RNA polymerase specialized sigma subunit